MTKWNSNQKSTIVLIKWLILVSRIINFQSSYLVWDVSFCIQWFQLVLFDSVIVSLSFPLSLSTLFGFPENTNHQINYSASWAFLLRYDFKMSNSINHLTARMLFGYGFVFKNNLRSQEAFLLFLIILLRENYINT